MSSALSSTFSFVISRTAFAPKAQVDADADGADNQQRFEQDERGRTPRHLLHQTLGHVYAVPLARATAARAHVLRRRR